MSLDKNNKAYENLGMSDFMKSRIYDRCMERGMQDQEEMVVNSFGTSSDATENRDVTTIVLDSSDLVRVRKKSSKYEKIMKCVASIMVVAILSSMLFFGKKYFNGINDENVALKNATTEKTKDETKSNLFEFNYYYDENEQEEYERVYREQISSLYGFHSEVANKNGVINNNDYKKYIDECYDSNGKLKKGYEEKTFELKSSDENAKKIKLVGKDFIVITAEDAKKNMESVKEEFLSEVEDGGLEIAKRLCDEYGNKFASYDYVYYLQGDNLLRVRLSEKPETWIYNSLSHKYARNKYSYSKFIGLKKVDTIVIAFRQKMTMKKQVGVEDKYFQDSNLIQGSVIQLIDKKSEEAIKNIKYLYILPTYEKGENILYYVDTNYNLWRIKDVKFYKENVEVTAEGLYDGKEFVEYDHEKECNGQIKTSFGVDKDYKAEKIAQNVYVETESNEELAREYNDGFVLKDKIEVYKKGDFKVLIEDEHVIYKEVKE
ncbi:hypothetical protein SAMN02745111_02099 [Eubacterium uniforme]|uniref:Uncharacterized protein n=1 Tax=Eubacterium uniforme TaxID=39495 RepID=A0A1T4W0L6_9FIRM|nr:hypothetical protein [Eubacterium uniforme]SKA70747.1 hypothetical protein SAMN02745111_02099 [Eubacterium uniforme]